MSTQKKWMTITGLVLAGLVGLLLTFSAVMKFAKPPDVMTEFVGRLGYPEPTVLPIGVVELTCLILFLTPRTSVLGAVLLTGYLGGATATHVRVRDAAFVGPVIVGIVVWLSLYLRDPRVRALLPWRGPVEIQTPKESP